MIKFPNSTEAACKRLRVTYRTARKVTEKTLSCARFARANRVRAKKGRRSADVWVLEMREERKREGRIEEEGKSEMQRRAKSSVGTVGSVGSRPHRPGRRSHSPCSTLTNDLVRGHV